MSDYARRLIAQAKAEGWKRLHLGKTGTTGPIPVEIWELEELEELILSDFWDEPVGWTFQDAISPNTHPHWLGSAIDEIPLPPTNLEGKPLGLQKLRFLGLRRVLLKDYRVLALMPELREIHLPDFWEEEPHEWVLQQLFEGMPNKWRNLRLGAHCFPSYDFLASQPELRTLHANLKNEDLAALKHVPQLERLYIQADEKLDPALIPDFPNLEVLKAGGSDGFPVIACLKFRRLRALWACDQEGHLATFDNQQGPLLAPLSNLECLGLGAPHGLDLRHLTPLDQVRQLHLGANLYHQEAQLAMLGSLQILGLYCKGLNNLDFLNQLPQLTKLQLKESGTLDLAPIGNLTHLECLELENVSSLSSPDLSQLQALTEMSLKGCEFTDLSGISACKSLKSLMLDGPKVADLSALAGLNKLEQLRFFSCPTLMSLTGIESHSSLRSLDLYRSSVKDLRPLLDLAAIQTLMISYSPVDTLPPLSCLGTLEWLDLDYTAIEDIRHLAVCHRLQHLDLTETQVVDLSPIGSLPALRYLSLRATPVKSLRPLEPLFRRWAHPQSEADVPERLLRFDCDFIDPPIKHEWGMWGAVYLEVLDYIDFERGITNGLHNRFAKQEISLYQRRKRTRLNLSNLGIRGCIPEEIWEFEDLEELSFEHERWQWENDKPYHKGKNPGRPNQITAFPMPPASVREGRSPGLAKLRSINLAHTGITDILPLQWMPALQEVRLDHTQVADLSPLQACTSIKTLSYFNTPAAEAENP